MCGCGCVRGGQGAVVAKTQQRGGSSSDFSRGSRPCMRPGSEVGGTGLVVAAGLAAATAQQQQLSHGELAPHSPLLKPKYLLRCMLPQSSANSYIVCTPWFCLCIIATTGAAAAAAVGWWVGGAAAGSPAGVVATRRAAAFGDGPVECDAVLAPNQSSSACRHVKSCSACCCCCCCLTRGGRCC